MSFVLYVDVFRTEPKAMVHRADCGSITGTELDLDHPLSSGRYYVRNLEPTREAEVVAALKGLTSKQCGRCLA